MRTSLLILFVVCFQMSFSFAQSWKHFESKKLDNRVFIEYGNRTEKTWVTPRKTYPMYIQDEKKWVVDVKKLLKEVFPSVTEEEKDILKQVSLFCVIDGGSTRCNRMEFSFPEDKSAQMLLLEPKLVELAERIKKWNFTDYDLYYSYPDKKDQSITNLSIPLFWIWK